MKGARQDKTRQDLIVASGARDVALDPCGVSRDLDTMLPTLIRKRDSRRAQILAPRRIL